MAATHCCASHGRGRPRHRRFAYFARFAAVSQMARRRDAFSGLLALAFGSPGSQRTKANLEKVNNVEGLNTISALTHPQIKELLSRKVVRIDMFDDKNIVEVIDPDNTKYRYCLCRNPESARRETNTRNALLAKTSEGLNKIASSKRKTTIEEISSRVGKLLSKTKMGKFITWEVLEEKLQWSLKAELIDTEQLIDGCYIIVSNVPQKKMQAQEIVASYKKLSLGSVKK